jgi:undecaprenyl-diphosphatase
MDTLMIFIAKYLWMLSVAIGVYVFWKASSKQRALLLALILPLSYVLGVVARTLYENPRPFVVGNFEPLIAHAADNGFPSDHVLLVAAIASWATLANRRFAVLLWILALLIAVSRVYVGVHHALDVAASIIISLIVGAMIYFFSKNKTNASDNTPTAK